MKGLAKSGKLMTVKNGKVSEAVDPSQVTAFPDTVKLEDLGNTVDIKGLKLVDLDVTIDKPKPKYTIAK